MEKNLLTLTDITLLIKFNIHGEAEQDADHVKSMFTFWYLPLFVDKEQNGGEAGNEECHYDGNYDDQVESDTFKCCQTQQKKAKMIRLHIYFRSYVSYIFSIYCLSRHDFWWIYLCEGFVWNHWNQTVKCLKSSFDSPREKCFITFGRRHIEGHAVCPGAVPCQWSGTHTGGVIPGAQVVQSSSFMLAVVLPRYTLMFLRLKGRKHTKQSRLTVTRESCEGSGKMLMVILIFGL